MITRNFGIMNDFFLAMNDDCDNRIEDKNIFQAEDPWSDRPASDLNTPNTTKVRWYLNNVLDYAIIMTVLPGGSTDKDKRRKKTAK